MRLVTATIVLVAALAGCSNHAATSAVAPGVLPLPLYDGSDVVVSRQFTAVVDRTYARNYPSIFPAGEGTYRDTEVIARSDAAFDDLSRWVDRISANPPEGYVLAPADGDTDTVHAQAALAGLAFAVFEPQDRARGGNLIVTVLDPAVLRARLGLVMGLIANYRALPAMFRDAADSRIQKAIGMTGSELIDPSLPIGQALAAYDAVKDSNERAIVVVDARKQ